MSKVWEESVSAIEEKIGFVKVYNLNFVLCLR